MTILVKVFALKEEVFEPDHILGDAPFGPSIIVLKARYRSLFFSYASLSSIGSLKTTFPTILLIRRWSRWFMHLVAFLCDWSNLSHADTVHEV